MSRITTLSNRPGTRLKYSGYQLLPVRRRVVAKRSVGFAGARIKRFVELPLYFEFSIRLTPWAGIFRTVEQWRTNGGWE